MTFYRKYGKRTLDLLCATLALLLLSPVLAVVALCVRIRLGSPVIFRQMRPGRGEELFPLFKFRTMTGEHDAVGNLLPDSRRLVPMGRLLRRASVDELPELINVIHGEMSLVGPRPLLPEYLQRYTTVERRRHEMKPGITGWAQVKGRNSTTWEKRFVYDGWYVENCSFWLDVKILALTLWKTLKGEGISQPGHATMPEFRRPAGRGVGD